MKETVLCIVRRVRIQLFTGSFSMGLFLDQHNWRWVAFSSSSDADQNLQPGPSLRERLLQLMALLEERIETVGDEEK